MRNEAIAQGIVARTPEVTSNLTLSDSLPFQDRGDGRNGEKYKMADTFADNGEPLIRANTDRVFGCAEVRARLIGKDDWPLLYFCRSCKYTREYLPAVQQDPNKREAYVTDGEATHTVDCVRYACATRPIIVDKKILSPQIDSRRTLTPKSILSTLKKAENRYGVR